MSRVTLRGVKFKNTVADDDPATLDWYEEGLWTPTLTAATPGTLIVPYTDQTGLFTRVGNLVVATGRIAYGLITRGTATGQAMLAGLPYPVKNVVGYYPICAVYPNNINVPVVGYSLVGIAFPSESAVRFRLLVDNGATEAINIDAFDSSVSAHLTISYQTG